MAIVVVQAKSTQKWYFLVSKPILKKFLGYFYPPPLPMPKKWVKMVPKQAIMGYPFQRPLLVGLMKWYDVN